MRNPARDNSPECSTNAAMRLPDKLEFNVEVKWDGETGGLVNVGGRRLLIEIPKEFGGKGGNFCPDELLMASIGGCLLTTLIWLAKRLKVKLSDVEVQVKGIVEGGLSGYEVSRVEASISVTIKRGEDKARVERLVKLAEEYCHITRALSQGVRLQLEDIVKVEGSKRA